MTAVHLPQAIVYLRDPRSSPIASEALLGELFSLSPAEARIALLLASGKTIAATAEHLGLNESTLGRRPGPDWYSEATLRDAAVWELARRFTVAPDEKGRNEVVAALGEKIRRFRKTPGSIRVKARGQSFHREIEYVNGDPWSDATRASWASVTHKFHQFCHDILDPAEIDKVVEVFQRLETVQHFGSELAIPSGA